MPRIHSVLQYNQKPSQALAAAEFWIRLLVETGIASKDGHVIGDVLCLRKSVSEDVIITAIEIEQLQENPTVAQRYLAACAWWLHRRPFGVERLPVKLLAHKCAGSLVRVEDWRVTSLDLKCYTEETFDMETIADLLPHLKVLRLSSKTDDQIQLVSPELLSSCHKLTVLELDKVDISDVADLPLEKLRTLSLTRCPNVVNIDHLSGANSLKEIDLSETGVSSISPLAACENLRKVRLHMCEQLANIAGLASMPALEEADISCTSVGDVSEVPSYADNLFVVEGTSTPSGVGRKRVASVTSSVEVALVARVA